MIIEFLLYPIVKIVEWAFSFINAKEIELPGWLGDTLSLISKAMMFFPVDVWVVVLTSVAFWLSIQFTWAVIEWVYRKIPGVN